MRTNEIMLIYYGGTASDYVSICILFNGLATTLISTDTHAITCLLPVSEV